MVDRSIPFCAPRPETFPVNVEGWSSHSVPFVPVNVTLPLSRVLTSRTVSLPMVAALLPGCCVDHCRIGKQRPAIAVARHSEIRQRVAALQFKAHRITALLDGEDAAGVPSIAGGITHRYAGREVDVSKVDGLGRAKSGYLPRVTRRLIENELPSGIPEKGDVFAARGCDHHLPGAADIGDAAAERAHDIESAAIHQKRAGILDRTADRQRCAAVDLDGRARTNRSAVERVGAGHRFDKCVAAGGLQRAA